MPKRKCLPGDTDVDNRISDPDYKPTPAAKKIINLRKRVRFSNPLLIGPSSEVVLNVLPIIRQRALSPETVALENLSCPEPLDINLPDSSDEEVTKFSSPSISPLSQFALAFTRNTWSDSDSDSDSSTNKYWPKI